MSSNNYQLYRATTIGDALKETLEEFAADEAVTQHLANRILLNFDKAINTKLATQTKNRQMFKANKLRAYRFCDNVWTFLVQDIEIKDLDSQVARNVNQMKIVACDGSKKG